MSDTTKQKKKFHLYQVTDVKKSAPPEGMNGKNWHSYTIQRGTSVIKGMKPGTLKAVTAHAKQVAADLNARSGVSAASTYAARRKT